MRDIKFRAKRIDTGEWIFGDLLQPTKLCNNYEISDFNNVNGDRYDVNPETIGQYTGLKDKNGTEIYEGDIVKICSHGRYVIGKIIYEHCGFTADVTYNKELPYGRSTIIQPFVEVIGNIYDNPKMIGGK